MLRHRLLDLAGHLLGLRTPRPAPEAAGTASEPPTALTAEAALAPHAALVRRIRAAYGHPDDEFGRHLHAPIAALAAWLHLLPGHPGSAFERRGGAIEQALTNCLYSLQAADGRTFEAGGAGSQASPDHARSWRLACALGGLFASLPDVLTRIEVVSHDGRVWPGIGLPLVDWLLSIGTWRYHYRWTSRSGELASPATYATFRCIPPDTMSFIAHGDARIAADLIGCIAGTSGARGQVSLVVRRIAATVAVREQDDATAPASDQLADTLKRLLGSSDWLPNSPGGHVWCGMDGLYLLWPDAAVKLLGALPGIRRTGHAASHDRLLQDLVDSGIVEATPSPLVHIRTPGLNKPTLAVRLANCHPVLGEVSPSATPLDLRVHAPEASQLPNGNEPAPRQMADDSTPLRGGEAVAAGTKGAPAPVQRVLDFAGGHADPDAAAEPSTPALSLDTSKITNPRMREAVDQVVARLDHSFDSMLAKPVNAGVFVALTEFIGQQGDAAAIVRALHEAQLLACDGTALDRRVVREMMEGAEMMGVVLRAAALGGYADWVSRWQAEHGGQRSPSVGRGS